MDLNGKKVLVAFFSHIGENYFGGKFIEISKGNTHIAAEMIAENCGADLFEIKPEVEYSHIYKECVEEAKRDRIGDARPALKEDKDIAEYDVIFLGYPNWCGTMPMPVWTFLDSHDFTDKIVCPFCTNEGSKMGLSEGDLAKLIPTAQLKAGLPIHGSTVKDAGEEIRAWMADL